ncbi:mannose-1-phosphate guanylyltransferase [Aeromicrobium sp. 636]|uniref:Mannose-1-phosphate guanylyltransferase n=1 Tax=Aeromicrobium senzhongii TaxID=2663859 RepID=A0A8I0EXY6_9ACTN|nr:mannose-1-phosphate guanylyltransferase [Aeromicrobium senzhongii]MBC9227210.1 mannose-1-phosphate guanylyltransferase [Aeromicrobium senzhongii]MCQ3999309.1 mannose-1-phosphate guanylyltransferase [Aeromicrobium sp. 636]
MAVTGSRHRFRGARRTTTVTAVSSFHAIIPAGGAGTRLWPLSRRARPKFLLDLEGTGRTLIQQTWDRMLPLTGTERIHVVSGADHGSAIAAQLPELVNLLLEPSPRDSMPAIGLAAAIIERADPDAIVGSFAADHRIPDPDRFVEAVREAIAVAEEGYIVTIGIEPTEPSTAFGYIAAGDALDGFASARAVRSFVEKPAEDTARGYLASGDHVWNAGMFVARASVLLDSLARFQPELAAGLRAIAATWGTPAFVAELGRTWPTLTKIAIDHAVAEPVAAEGGMAVVPAPFGWDDLGDFASIAPLGSSPDVLWVDADGVARGREGVQIAVLGLRNVAVVQTDDAVLVLDLAQSQRVKDVVALLKDAGRDDLL